MTDPRDLRFIVAGCGSIGRRHIANLLALGATSVCGVDPDVTRLRAVESECGIGSFDSLDTALASGADVVLVTAPPRMHIPIAMQAARAGCHLFLEKPLSDSLDGVPELLKEVGERGLLTLVGCNLRFHPGLMQAKQLLEGGVVGRLTACRAQFGQYLPDWRPQVDYRASYSARRDLGGGIILDAIHEVDYVRWMIGEVTTVACFADRLSNLDMDTEDTAAILLRSASGSIGEIHVDCVQRTYTRTCDLIGDLGTIRWDFPSGTTRWFSAQVAEWEESRPPQDWEINDMYLDEMKHWLACLEGEQTPRLDLLEATRVLEIALAAKASAETKAVIHLERTQ